MTSEWFEEAAQPRAIVGAAPAQGDRKTPRKLFWLSSVSASITVSARRRMSLASWRQLDTSCTGTRSERPRASRRDRATWTPAHENHQPDFPRRGESLSTAFTAALMRHRLSPLSFRLRRLSDIHEHHSTSVSSPGVFAVGSLGLAPSHRYVGDITSRVGRLRWLAPLGVRQEDFWEVSIATE